MRLMVCGLLAGLVLLAQMVSVEGTTPCPEPARVAERLAEILPTQTAVAADALPDRARLSAEGDELIIRLESAAGVLLGTRRLPLTAACEDLAAALAVSLAAWESDVHPQFVATLTARPPELVMVPAQPAPFTRWSPELGAALGLGAALDAPALAGDAVLSGWLVAPDRSFSWRADLEGQSRRALVLAEGRAIWRRWSLGLGAEGRLFAARNPSRGRRLSWFALARLAWLDLRGEGFLQNHATTAFDPGLTTGLRWLWDSPIERWAVGLELAASLWPVRHDAVFGGNGTTGRLPATEGFLRVGVTRGGPR